MTVTIQSVELPVTGGWVHTIEFDSTVPGQKRKAWSLFWLMAGPRHKSSANGWLVSSYSTRYGNVRLIDRVELDKWLVEQRAQRPAEVVA